MNPNPVAYYAKAALGVALVAGLLAAAWAVRHVLVLILISFVLAVGLDPGVRFLESRFGRSRAMATTIILLGALGFLVLFFALVIPPIVDEVQQFVGRLPEYVEELQASGGRVGELATNFDISEQLAELERNAPQLARSSFDTIVGVTGTIVGGVFSVLTILVLTVYFTNTLPALEAGIVALFPAARQDEYRKLVDRATEKIGGYASGQITVSLIAGICAFVAFLVIGLPFPAALAMWVALTTLIPSVGALVGAVLCILVASFDGLGTAIVTALYILVYQQIENYVISPRIMKKAVDLSPAAVIVSVLIGGSLLGFVGALLALPMAAAAKVVLRELWLGRSQGIGSGRAPRRRRKAPPPAPAPETG